MTLNATHRRKNSPPEELKSTQLPDKPWNYVAVNLLTVSEGNHLLVIMDYYSKWPEVACMQDINAKSIMNGLELAFITHGYPKYLRINNGQPVVSREIQEYLTIHVIIQIKGIPYWPQSNGEVEQFNRTILKAIKIEKVREKSWKEEIKRFLLKYRTNPHTVTGVSPAKLLMNSRL